MEEYLVQGVNEQEILPSGMTLDDNANIVKMDVAKLIEDSKDADEESEKFDTEE